MPRASWHPGTVVLADGGYPAGAVASAMLAGASQVVCCDGAAKRFVAEGGLPAAIVGDCDSLDADLTERFRDIIHCDCDQETNDLTKAVRYCADKGCRDITILGATGKREDHTIANISLLVDYMEFTRIRMVTDSGVLEPIAHDTFFESFPGQQMSVFTLSPSTLITTVDLRYPLHRAALRGWWQGSLNQAGGGSFGIRTTGPAIVYRLFPE